MKAENISYMHKYIVGIGASAGGLEALQKLFTVLPSDTGFPYIVIQHLSPDYKSMLAHILGKYTKMPVTEALNGEEIENDHVYIIQPGKLMTISNDKLILTDLVVGEHNLPIDAFFESLAEEAGARAIAIVLSGTGSDGSNGIKAVKERDGLVMAQDLDSSKFDGMPRSAMRTGTVDAQISPEEIAMELKHIAKASEFAGRERTQREVDAELLTRVYSILKEASNVNFSHYKQTTLIRRMERRMMLCHMDSMSDYVEHLQHTPDEARMLSREILIGVTGFFRDPEFFQALKEKALVKILERAPQDEPIRVWVAGCSTGEEAYSIAILFSEIMESMNLQRTVKIFATDLDRDAIDMAGKGIYGDNIMESVSPARLAKYFTRKSNYYSVHREIRRMIVFSAHNIIQDPPFGRLDLISCRNMLIYFQPVLQNDLFAIFHQSLKDGGFLFLGKSETIGAHNEAYPAIDTFAKIFTHRKNVKIAGGTKLTLPRFFYSNDEISVEKAFSSQMFTDHDANEEDKTVNEQLMGRFLPPTLIINDNNDLVRTVGDTENFLHLTTGRFSRQLFDVLTSELIMPVSTLLKEARTKSGEATYTGVGFNGERKNDVVDIAIMPVGRVKDDETVNLAIAFSQCVSNIDKGIANSYSVDAAASRRIADLEQELGDVKNKLSKSQVDQEYVNTELQAANEELLTANEEMQSSNEELQSVNEELYTVNSEYQQKLNELNNLNDDIANFLSSTMTGIIFVDEKLNIRRYTDYMTSEFSVMDQDIGRSLALLSYHFPSISIIDICSNVLKTLKPDEREVITSRNKVFFMRVAPYKSAENRIMGCVITLMDVTVQKQGQATLLDAEKQILTARQAVEAKSKYLIRVSRRLHTPVNALLNLSLSAKTLTNGDARLDATLEKIMQNVDYINAIVSDMSQITIVEQLSTDQNAQADAESNVASSVKESIIKSEKVLMPEKTEHRNLGGCHVLVAEDNPLNRTVLETILTNGNMTYTSAVNGSMAVKAFSDSGENTFDCILMDARMPVLDGVKAAASIRACDRNDAKTVPIIGILTRGFEEDDEQACAAGMNGCVTKPVDQDKLFEMMARLIKRQDH